MKKKNKSKYSHLKNIISATLIPFGIIMLGFSAADLVKMDGDLKWYGIAVGVGMLMIMGGILLKNENK